MRISVNLANRPFVELRPLFARLRLAMVVLTLLAIGLWFALHSLSAKARVAESKMDTLKAETQQYLHERQVNEARMHQPENMAVLERSQYLNAVFARKSFSWTAVMMDLEKVLPAGIQVTSIDPSITKEGDVNIRLRVSGDRERAVQLVRNLETSQRFLSPRLSAEQAQTQEGSHNTNAPVLAPGAVQFEILSGYNPLPAKPVSTEKNTEDDSPKIKVTKKRVPSKSSLPKGVVKAPAQKGGSAMTTVAEKKRTAAAAKQWAEKASQLATLLNLHIAGVVVLGLLNLYLLVHIAFVWSAANSQNDKALSDQTIARETAKIARQPLEGLDDKLAKATKDADKFYKQRLPFANSEVVGELGALAKKQGVKLTRANYSYSPVLEGTAGELTEEKMDASLSGDYRPLVLFVNALERDKMFFLINGVTLTGQQSGTVGLRLRLTTYLRSPVGTENTEKSVGEVDEDATGSTHAPAAGGRR